MSDETVVDEREPQLADEREPRTVDEMRLQGEDPFYAPQAPGDVGYEAPAIIPELDLQGGTVFVVGGEEFPSMQEAQESLAPALEPTADDEAAAELERPEE